MNKEKRIELYKKAIDTWGIEAQRNMAFEEIGELLTVLAQDRRGRVTKEEIITELFNMLEKLYLDGCLSDEERELLDKLSDEYLIIQATMKQM